MTNIFVDPSSAEDYESILVNGKCYKRVGPSQLTPDTLFIDEGFDSCEECLTSPSPSPSPSPPPEPPASMYAYYSFEGTSVSGGTAWENKLDPGNNDLITTGTTDINNNVASNVNGRSGQVLYCPRNGSNNFFSGQFVPEPGDRTYTMWWCPETISTGGVVNQSLLTNFNPSWNWDDDVWDWNGIPFAQESTVSLNNWYFIAVTQTLPGFQCNIWQGDVSTAPVKNSTTINSNFNNPIIGGFNGIFCINGWMDDVRIFDSILTDSEINDVWNLDK